VRENEQLEDYVEYSQSSSSRWQNQHLIHLLLHILDVENTYAGEKAYVLVMGE